MSPDGETSWVDSGASAPLIQESTASMVSKIPLRLSLSCVDGELNAGFEGCQVPSTATVSEKCLSVLKELNCFRLILQVVSKVRPKVILQVLQDCSSG